MEVSERVFIKLAGGATRISVSDAVFEIISVSPAFRVSEIAAAVFAGVNPRDGFTVALSAPKRRIPR